jgi:glycosyltransferase involved in cell wall biosynthesis
MVSKFRRVQGGPERHLLDLMEGLAARGHEVRLFSSEDVEAAGGSVFSTSSASRGRAKSAKALLWNSYARDLLSDLLKEFQPDLVHFHSIYHQLSPSVLGVFEGPTLMTLHDYKLSAPCYSLYREGRVCEACVGKVIPTPAIRYKCVSDSWAGSSLCAAEELIHRRRYRSFIDRFIVPSKFAYDVAVNGGLPPNRISLIPWGVAVEKTPTSYEQRVAFFGGRLHRNKGLGILLEAWQSLPTGHGCQLRIAGEGDLEGEVRAAAAANPTVNYLGMLPGSVAIQEVKRAALAVMPSLVPETMGLAAIEALVVGTPVLTSRRGALADLSGPGVWTLPNVDTASIGVALVKLLIDDEAGAYRRSLAERDLSMYDFQRMLTEIEAVYLRTADEVSRSRRRM